MMRKERNLNADLIRCAAVYSVLSVHFLLNSGFYGVPVEGADMLVMCMYRSLFMTCVPLFMILTGYLMWQKKLSNGYYKGLLRTVEIYVLVSIADLLFKRFYQGKDVTFVSGLLGIFSYESANYSWYIEMYIGLFLMIPFLNLAYHGLQGQKQKRTLIITMMALTFLPKILNLFVLTDPAWWQSPAISKEYDKLVPSFFTAMYPITYYFIGAYLREYGWKLNKKQTALLLALVVAGFGCYNFYRSDGGKFVWGANSTWGGENLVTAVLVFGLLLQVRVNRWPQAVKSALVYISRVSLGIYLMSWMFDQIIYKEYLIPLVPVVNERWKYFIVVVPCVFVAATGGASVIYLIRDAIHKACGRKHFSNTL